MDYPVAIGGTFTDNGIITATGFNFNLAVTAALTLAADTTLAGTGTVILNGGSQINATNNATLTQATGHVIGGNGTINANLVNNGTLEGSLTIDSPTFTNNGLLEATDNDTLQQGGGSTLTNYNSTTQTLTGGTYEAIATTDSANLNLNIGPVAVNAATVVLSGATSNSPPSTPCRITRAVSRCWLCASSPPAVIFQRGHDLPRRR